MVTYYMLYHGTQTLCFNLFIQLVGMNIEGLNLMVGKNGLNVKINSTTSSELNLCHINLAPVITKISPCIYIERYTCYLYQYLWQVCCCCRWNNQASPTCIKRTVLICTIHLKYTNSIYAV